MKDRLSVVLCVAREDGLLHVMKTWILDHKVFLLLSLSLHSSIHHCSFFSLSSRG